jgi:hypothetical protein
VKEDQGERLGLRAGERAAWLPGARTDVAAEERWRELAASVEALAARYPRQLWALPDDWARWADLAEQLGALCAWRAALDVGEPPVPPETELRFHEALDRMRALLDERARDVLVGDPERARHPRRPEEQRARRAAREEAAPRANAPRGDL